jgi:hypothetical protein
MRLGRTLRTLATTFAMTLVGASWTSCSNSNSAGASDAGVDADAGVLDSTIQDDSGCDPCVMVCPCDEGDMFFNTGKCVTETCTNGMWGGNNYCEGEGCPPDASDDGDTCDPCQTTCLCYVGSAPRFDPCTGREVTCPSSGEWGPGILCQGNACEAGVDAANEAGADVASDAAPAGEAGAD